MNAKLILAAGVILALAGCTEKSMQSDAKMAKPQETKQAAAPAPMMKKAPKGKTYVIYYPSGGTRLNADANKIIREAVAHAGQYDKPRVVISGYSDSQGDAVANEALSAARARVVAAAMLLRGVDGKVIKEHGYGEDFQAVKTADGVAEPKNRRVEIQVGGS